MEIKKELLPASAESGALQTIRRCAHAVIGLVMRDCVSN